MEHYYPKVTIDVVVAFVDDINTTIISEALVDRHRNYFCTPTYLYSPLFVLCENTFLRI